MANKNNNYYYLDIKLTDLKIVSLGITETATLSGDTEKPEIHRLFLTKGQYNKLKAKLETK